MQNPHQTLGRSEWMAIASLLFILASFFLVSKINAARNVSPIINSCLPANPHCFVTIQGAVARPGTYEVPIGTPLKKVIRKSRPSLYADFRSIDLEKRINASVSLEIEKLKEIEICVKGEGFDRISLSVPVGTRVCDLKLEPCLAFCFAHRSFKGRRVLKPHEVIEIGDFLKDRGST